jgi:hypothetical protein
MVISWFAVVKNQRESMCLLEYQATYACVTQLMRYDCDIYYSTGDGNSISSQLSSSCQGNRYDMEKTGGTARPSRTKSHLPGHSPPASQAGRRVGPAL